MTNDPSEPAQPNPSIVMDEWWRNYNAQVHKSVMAAEQHLEVPAGTILSIPNDPDFIATVKTYAVVEPILNELIASRPPSFAEVFSQVLGRPIAYVGITPEQAEQGMKARSMPDWLVAHLVASAKLGAAGAFSTENTKLIEDLVGRAPITTKQFVEDFKAAFS